MMNASQMQVQLAACCECNVSFCVASIRDLPAKP
jgi:hypothetical protein